MDQAATDTQNEAKSTLSCIYSDLRGLFGKINQLPSFLQFQNHGSLEDRAETDAHKISFLEQELRRLISQTDFLNGDVALTSAYLLSFGDLVSLKEKSSKYTDGQMNDLSIQQNNRNQIQKEFRSKSASLSEEISELKKQFTTKNDEVRSIYSDCVDLSKSYETLRTHWNCIIKSIEATEPELLSKKSIESSLIEIKNGLESEISLTSSKYVKLQEDITNLNAFCVQLISQIQKKSEYLATLNSELTSFEKARKADEFKLQEINNKIQELQRWISKNDGTEKETHKFFVQCSDEISVITKAKIELQKEIDKEIEQKTKLEASYENTKTREKNTDDESNQYESIIKNAKVTMERKAKRKEELLERQSLRKLMLSDAMSRENRRIKKIKEQIGAMEREHVSLAEKIQAMHAQTCKLQPRSHRSEVKQNQFSQSRLFP